jgi:hypothetical protein
MHVTVKIMATVMNVPSNARRCALQEMHQHQYDMHPCHPQLCAAVCIACCREDLMHQMKDLQQQADDGNIPAVPMTEVPGDDAAAAADGSSQMPGSVADAVVDSVVKAGEVVGDAVAQAKEAAAAAVGKAGSFLKDKLKSFGGVRQEAEL